MTGKIVDIDERLEELKRYEIHEKIGVAPKLAVPMKEHNKLIKQVEQLEKENGRLIVLLDKSVFVLDEWKVKVEQLKKEKAKLEETITKIANNFPELRMLVKILNEALKKGEKHKDLKLYATNEKSVTRREGKKKR